MCVSKFARTEGAEAFVVRAHKSEAVAKYSYSALALGGHFCSRPVRFSTFFKPQIDRFLALAWTQQSSKIGVKYIQMT